MDFSDRISNIKSELSERGLNTYLLPTGDPHFSEYPAERWQTLRFISGFSGSNGFLMLSQYCNALWTDSRYYLQAEKELQGSGIKMFKEECDDDWKTTLSKLNAENIGIGIDGRLFSQKNIEEISDFCAKKNWTFKTDFKPNICEDIQKETKSTIFAFSEKYCGTTFQEKKKQIFKQTEQDFLLLCSLEEIAWTFNLRGADTPHTPVNIAFALLGKNQSHLFINGEAKTEETKRYLSENQIEIHPYEAAYQVIPQLTNSSTISVDPRTTNHELFSLLNPQNIFRKDSPIEAMKALKNDVEISNLRNAMVKDGVALVKAMAEIENRIKNGRETTETQVAEILRQHRSAQPLFFCESFSTIAGYASNGAIVHYNAQPGNDAKIGTSSLLLIDSGANFLDGTTDITRVFSFGTPTDQQKTDYTLVLKGHIALATSIFPKGTSGMALDALARQFLWQKGLDYGHGTGHGIGFFLCVHEGPQRISKKASSTPLQPGMVLSDEPGLYRTGEYGIRIENTMTVRPYQETEFGEFLQFETLTLFPYERKLIKKSMLTESEIEWINAYHKKVYEKIAAHLADPSEELEWLKKVTREI